MAADTLYQEARLLREQLKEEMASAYPIKAGQKVLITFNHTRTTEQGIFEGFYIRHGRIEPLIFKVKKDGTKGANQLHIWAGTQIEAV